MSGPDAPVPLDGAPEPSEPPQRVPVPAWSPQPPGPVRAGRLGATAWTGIGVGIGLAVVAVVGVFILYVRVMSEAHDHRQLDDAEILETSVALCTSLFEATDRIEADVTLDDPARVEAETAAVRAVADGLSRFDRQRLLDDEPAEQWTNDWAALADAREELADGSRRRAAMPLTPDGYPIAYRLNHLVAGCGVPASIIDDFDVNRFPRNQRACDEDWLAICVDSTRTTWVSGVAPGTTITVTAIRAGEHTTTQVVVDEDGRAELDGIALGDGVVVVIDLMHAGHRTIELAA